MFLVQRAVDEVWCRTGNPPALIRVSTVKSEDRDVATVDPMTWWACVREMLVQWGWWGNRHWSVPVPDDVVDDYAGRSGWRFRGVAVAT